MLFYGILILCICMGVRVCVCDKQHIDFLVYFFFTVTPFLSLPFLSYLRWLLFWIEQIFKCKHMVTFPHSNIIAHFCFYLFIISFGSSFVYLICDDIFLYKKKKNTENSIYTMMARLFTEMMIMVCV